MSNVRVLVGTRKGAFILTADGARKRWKVSGPHFAGWEIYHVKGSPVDPNRIYASQTSGWFGQIIQRSDDGGKTWNTPGSNPEELKSPDGTPKGESNKFVYDGVPGTHQWYEGTQHPWEFKRVWHLGPSLVAPGIRGSSSGFCIWSPRFMIPSMFTPVWKTRRCLNRRTAASRRRNCPVS